MCVCVCLSVCLCPVKKGKGIVFNVGDQTGKDCLLTCADGVKVADRRDRTTTFGSESAARTTYTTGHHSGCVLLRAHACVYPARSHGNEKGSECH